MVHYLSNFITGLGNAEGVDFLPNGNILIGNGATSSVKMFDSDGNYIEDLIPSGSGGLITPNAVVIREINVLSDDDALKSSSFSLEQNYPNPFNPTTNIRFRIADRGFATLKVFNVLGNEIESLVNKELVEGEYEFTFDASGIPSGIYFYQLLVTALQSKILTRYF